MTLANPNPAARLPAALAGILNKRKRSLVIMDIGARDGIDSAWTSVVPIADFIFFEPDAKECARLRGEWGEARVSRMHYYPIAVDAKTGRRRFYITKFPQSSSFFPTNQALMNRYPMKTTETVREVEVKTVSLDRFIKTTKFDHVDFIKIDVEGAEYDVLKGARKMLASHKVLGLKVELPLHPDYRKTKSMSDIDAFLRECGFHLFDMSFLRFPRWTLPYGRLHGSLVGNQFNIAMGLRCDYGQIQAGDGLYFRDPVADRIQNAFSLDWDADSLLRLCALLDVYDYGDCAIEILETFRGDILAEVDVDPLMDALVPTIGTISVRYDLYRSASNDARIKQNIHSFGLNDWVPPPMGYGRKPGK